LAKSTLLLPIANDSNMMIIVLFLFFFLLTTAGSDKVEVKDQQIQTKLIEAKDQCMRQGLWQNKV